MLCVIFISSPTFLFCGLQSVENLRKRLKDARRVLIVGNGGIALELVHAFASVKTCQVWRVISVDWTKTLGHLRRLHVSSPRHMAKAAHDKYIHLR